MTTGAAQFGVSPDGSIFTAHGDGWTIRGPRVDVTRLSWLLDEAADILQDIRGGAGGRFYERNGRFFLADGRTTILEVVDEPEPSVRTEVAAPPMPSRTWWQQVVNSIFGSDEEDAAPLLTKRRPQLPEDVRRAREAPVRSRGESAQRTWPPTKKAASRANVCPVHFILLGPNDQCDDCRID